LQKFVEPQHKMLPEFRLSMSAHGRSLIGGTCRMNFLTALM
jgi:hypothetical protein